MMRSMNNKAFSFIFLGILVLAALSLVLSDWTGSFRSGVGSGDIAKIGKERITQSEFARSVDRTLRAQSIPPQQAYQAGIITQILTTEVWQRMLAHAAHTYGIAVGDDLLVQKLGEMAAPIATEQKSTPSAVVKQFIQAQGMTEVEFMDTMRRDISNGIVRQIITAGADAPSPLMIDALVAHAGQKRRIDYFVLRNDAVTTVPMPDGAALESYYEGRKAEFMLPERRDAKMIIIKRSDILKDVVVTDDEIAKFYEENKAVFGADSKLDTVRGAIVDRLKDDKGGDIVDTRLDALDAAHERGDTIDTVAKDANVTPVILGGITRDGLRADGTDAFADLANVKAGILGAMFADPETTAGVSAPIELSNGDIAMINVGTIVPATPKPLSEVSEQLTGEYMAEQRRTANIMAAQGFLPDLISGKKSVGDVAREKGAAVSTITDVTRDQKQLPLGLDRAAWTRLFGAEVNAPIFQPVQGGVMVGVVKSATLADPKAASADVVKAMTDDTARAQKDEQIAQYLGALTDRYGTKINNKLIQQMYAPRSTDSVE